MESAIDSFSDDCVYEDTLYNYTFLIYIHRNRRDMESAIDSFSDDCVYEDTLFPKVFRGKVLYFNIC